MEREIIQHIEARLKQLGFAMKFNKSLADDPKIYARSAEDFAESASFGLKSYVWGGEDHEFVVSAIDGPLERFKKRHPWLQKVFGTTRTVDHRFKVSEVFPDLNERVNSIPSGTLTLRVAVNPPLPEYSVNIYRVQRHRLAALEYALMQHLSPAGQGHLQRFVEEFVIPPDKEDS